MHVLVILVCLVIVALAIVVGGNILDNLNSFFDSI